MKGESREAKGHETTGGGRTWYGKRKTLTPLLKREKISLNDCINDAFIVKVQTFNIVWNVSYSRGVKGREAILRLLFCLVYSTL